MINSTRCDGNGTDDRLLQLADDTEDPVTADFNLAQVASVKNLKVMNLSELVIALRPEVSPAMSSISRSSAKARRKARSWATWTTERWWWSTTPNLIGQRKPVVVTGALQTPTGRMVFARLGTGTSAAGSSEGQGETVQTEQSQDRRPPLGSCHPSRRAVDDDISPLLRR